jgi:hypothetical protein
MIRERRTSVPEYDKRPPNTDPKLSRPVEESELPLAGPQDLFKITGDLARAETLQNHERETEVKLENVVQMYAAGYHSGLATGSSARQLDDAAGAGSPTGLDAEVVTPVRQRGAEPIEPIPVEGVNARRAGSDLENPQAAPVRREKTEPHRRGTGQGEREVRSGQDGDRSNLQVQSIGGLWGS